MQNSKLHKAGEKSGSKENHLDTIKIFRECGTCSQTFTHLINQEFNRPKDPEERAMDPMAGGLMNQGHQCGMLWGTSLAIGAESLRRHKSQDKSIGTAIIATQHVLNSFLKKTNTVNCKEIIGIDLSKTFGLIKFILQTTVQGVKNNPCYNLAEQWAPDAIKSTKKGLSLNSNQWLQQPISCASEVIGQMGASKEEKVMVAGFAGGLGLTGSACGALSAVIWFKTLSWCKKHPRKNPPYFNNKEAKKILKKFYEITSSEILCKNISGKGFSNIDEHSEYIKNGGCKELMISMVLH